jgi:ATP-dependent DNA helicase RecG
MWLRGRIRDLTLPALVTSVDTLDEPEGRLLLVVVGRNGGSEPHSVRVSKNGGRRTPRRVGTRCHDMERLAELVAWSEQRTSYDWSAASSGRPVSSARTPAIQALRDLLRRSGEAERLRVADLDDTELLRRLQLLRGDGMLNRGGELLVCAADSPRLVYLNRPSGSARAERRVELTGRGLAEELQAITDAISAAGRIVDLPDTDGLVRRAASALPEPVVREALVNAIMHRDWEVPEPVVVEQSGDTLVVFSPGTLFGGVTIDSLLTTQSRTRNRLLGDVLRSLRVAEREGTGVDRMYIELIRLGHRPPAFEERDGGVRVAIVGGDPVPEVVCAHNALPSSLRDDARAAVVIDLLRSASSITLTELAGRVHQSDAELADFLRLAEQSGLLRPTASPRPGGVAAWRLADQVRSALGPVLPYFSRPIHESVSLVERLARQQGIVRNQDVQDLLGVNQPRASQILRRATEDGKIRLAPGARPTGRGTAYAPNP